MDFILFHLYLSLNTLNEMLVDGVGSQIKWTEFFSLYGMS